MAPLKTMTLLQIKQTKRTVCGKTVVLQMVIKPPKKQGNYAFTIVN